MLFNQRNNRIFTFMFPAYSIQHTAYSIPFNIYKSFKTKTTEGQTRFSVRFQFILSQNLTLLLSDFFPNLKTFFKYENKINFSNFTDFNGNKCHSSR